ncbi:MAG: hypothetical protein A3J74_10395 [Elusimicrobia bacterium RIFCSPHIGHO2_02_FULL_57_9]|nr:MAG: hypothetical protein A3J74_10395 [Elusimicrobia bacterium RIFCSPHIGHO2_02_FULL_57_9]
MIIFWRLMFGHLLADFTFQTNLINRWKRNSIRGMLVHCAAHPICYAALTYPYLNDVWVDAPFFPLNGWACVLVLFAAHFIEDQWRVFNVFKSEASDNTLYFILDQLIHYFVIFAVIPGSLRGAVVTGLMPEKWPVLGCLFVLVTHASTVFIYFLEKDFLGAAYPGAREKYLAMGQRLALALCFLVPGNVWPLLALGWLSIMHYARKKKYVDSSRLGFYAGGGAAAFCGLSARLIYYCR